MNKDTNNSQNNTTEKDNELQKTGVIRLGKFTVSRKLLISLLLFLFIAFFVIQNTAFIKKDASPKFTDYQMIKALHYYDLFMNDEYSVLKSISYPPLVYVVTRSYFLRLGVSMEAARLSLGIFWVIFLLSMYGIGYELGDEYSGFLVMLLAASSPHTLNYSRSYYLDFPQAAATALSFYFLLKCDSFRNRLHSILFGIATAISILTKWSAIFFIVLPILWFLVPRVFRSLKALAAFIVFLVTTGWWLFRLSEFYRWLTRQNDPVRDWFQKYLYIFAPPLIACLIIIIVMDFLWRKKENYPSSPEYSVINFVYSSILTVFPAGMWFVYAGKKNADRFFDEVRDISYFKQMAANLNQMTGAAATMFNYLPLLIIVAVVYLFYSKKDLFKLLILPVNFIASFFLVLKLATLDRDPSRYIISLIVFSAAFCGYWITKTGKMKPLLLGIAAFLSIISILAWTVIPGNLPIYYPVRLGLTGSAALFTPKILAPEPPNEMKADLAETVNNFKQGKRDYDFLFFVSSEMDEREKQAFYELLLIEMYKQSKRMGIEGTDYRSVDRNNFRSHWRMLSSRKIPNVLIMTGKESSPETFLKIVQKTRGVEIENVSTYQVTNEYKMILIHIKRI